MGEDEGRPRTLLVVEDNAILREGLAVILRREGYAAALAGDGQQALDYLRDNPPPGLILLDVFLPVLDGWQFLERLRGAGARLPIPVIITTGSTAIGPD